MKVGTFPGRHTVYGALAVVCMGALTLAAYTYYPRAPMCGTLRYLPKISCYMNEVRHVMKKGGAEAGFVYAESMQNELDYALNHFVMHEIGRSAYAELHGDIPAALHLQDKHRDPEAFDYELDGYRHGLFEAFFTEKGTLDADLAGEVCPDAIHVHRTTPVGLYAYPPKQIQQDENDQDQCFHAVGHGIMYANNNNITLSLSQCDKMPEDWQQQWCYYGAFMQYTYTNWPGYESELERHTNVPDGQTMAELCNTLPKRQQNACSRLSGRGFIDASTRNSIDHVEKVFGQCDAVLKQYREACIVETAGSFLPEAFAKEPKQAFDMCATVYSDLMGRRACTYGAVSGFKQGAGQFSYKNLKNDLCELVEPKLNDVCLRANGRGYTWF